MQTLSLKLTAWRLFTLVQVLGCALLMIGASYSLTSYLAGVVALFPGSLLGIFVPLYEHVPAFVEHISSSDAATVGDIAYLPITVVLNVFLFFGARRIFLHIQDRRSHSRFTQVEANEP